MPAQPNTNLVDQDFLDFEAFQQEPKSRQSTTKRGQGKGKRKHERTGENTIQGSPFETQDQELIPAAPATSRSPPPPQSDLSSKLDPSLESLDEASKESFTNESSRGTIAAAKGPLQRDNAYEAQSQRHSARSSMGHGRYATAFSPSTSPRMTYRALVSRSPGYKDGDGPFATSPTYPNSHPGYPTSFYRPPLPHLDQPHFYAAPELNFGQAVQSDKQEPRDIGFCAFDKLPYVDLAGRVSHIEVLLTSHANSLDVLQILGTRLIHLVTLKNLRGSVIDAKIVPGTHIEAPIPKSNVFIALVIHGPATTLASERGGSAVDEGLDDFDASQSMLQALQGATDHQEETTVEIYDLVDAQFVTTLFRSPREPVKSTGGTAVASGEASIGALSVHAAGRFITISSGTSGEIYIFSCDFSTGVKPRTEFNCIGKTWTVISRRRRRSHSAPARDTEQARKLDDKVETGALVIIALSARFLAIVSPSPSSQTTCHGHVEGYDKVKTPGLSSHAPPDSPSITCDTETPATESLLGRVARDATKEFVKGAKWFGNQGVAAWNTYWTKPPSPDQQVPVPDANHQFPPTHAQDGMHDRARTGPALVSILDLERLAQNQHSKEYSSLQPLAVFSLASGCSAMSFSPQGARLFTASAKGDVQQVWDLMRMSSNGAIVRKRGAEVPKLPYVREVAKFTRITEARIIEIAWLHPNGEKFAFLTDNGTVHTNDMPLSAFHWPPLRLTGRVANGLPSGEHIRTENIDEAGSSESSGSTLGSAFGLLARGTQPLLAAVRGQQLGPGNTLPNLSTITSSAGAGAKGGKAAAVGLNRALTATASGTVNAIRHLGENRFSLPGNSDPRFGRCLSWIGTADDCSLAVTAAGIIRTYNIRRGGALRSGKRRPSAVGSKSKDLMIPHRREGSNQDQVNETVSTLRPKWMSTLARQTANTEHVDTNPLSFAEIETHAPYQPFHTDGRVGFCIYTTQALDADPHHLDSTEPWAFGDEIPSTRVRTIHPSDPGNDGDDGQLRPFEMENVVQRQDDEDGQQIVVTTRRKKHRSAGPRTETEDQEFFEDDLEVVDFAQHRV